jgi:hypothetical protein
VARPCRLADVVVPQSVSPSDLILPPADASLEEINTLLHA